MRGINESKENMMQCPVCTLPMIRTEKAIYECSCGERYEIPTKDVSIWCVVDQEGIDALNETVNEQWKLLAHLKHMSRWNGSEAVKRDIGLLWEGQEQISEALNKAIEWI